MAEDGQSRATSILADVLESRGFAVVRRLAGASRGSNCNVFCVRERDDPSSVPYVAKAISLTGLDAKGIASAQQEVSLLKNLPAHPNLIAYRESFLEDSSDGGILFIVMSLAEDGDLRRVVTDVQAVGSMLPEPVVLCWLRQTLAGLHHLHSQGVVHRDLKSSNIFLSGGRRHLRIGDFGISRVLESTALATSVVGTPAYMSPELMRNERYDFHVDMWALGCVSYELCTLRLPFEARSLLDLVFQVVESEPNWGLWRVFSEELRRFTERLLSKEPSRRPTATELLKEPSGLFGEGGRAAQEPNETLWAAVFRPGSKDPVSPDGKSVGDQLTTAGTRAQSMSSKGDGASGTWCSTPRMSWESSAGQGATGLEKAAAMSPVERACGFMEKLQAAREAQHEFSRQEFETFLGTARQELLQDIQKSGVAGSSQRG
eukprot:CAMPEP_0170587162 /NCGR_PEP_ID=MMETSP0224-20130122/10137_1 /TAXON_ID=285029 /ORGANISM="Togula jolla, Strain CCCM 725" /LENGTH=430 /DNA_ID=CAMNT_0010910769 /DNA_START=1 /DNA_END=1289 /DNA_ORIENTATION=+